MKIAYPKRVFVTSDLHLDKNTPLENEQIFSGWYEKVSDNDFVFILGDVCQNYKKFKHTFKQLPGNIILVKGNHDHFNNSHIFDIGIEMYETEAVLLHYSHPNKKYNIILSHKPLPPKMLKMFAKHIDLVLHGHNHRQKKLVKKINGTFYVNVIAKKWDYWVLEINDIIRKVIG